MLRRPVEPAQYAAADYRKLLAKHGLIGSMSRRGNPYENAMAESFMKTLKVEAVYLMGTSKNSPFSGVVDLESG